MCLCDLCNSSNSLASTEILRNTELAEVCRDNHLEL